MLKIFLYVIKFSHGLINKIKAIIVSKTFRWIAIGCTFVVCFVVLGNYLERLMILEIIQNSTRDTQPISLNVNSVNDGDVYELKKLEDTTEKQSFWQNIFGGVINWWYPKQPSQILDMNDLCEPPLEHYPYKQGSRILRFGYPSLNSIRHYEDFVLSYDKKNKIPHWVAEYLTSDSLCIDKGLQYAQTPRPDPYFHPYFWADIWDIVKAGFVVRQLAPIPNHWSSQKSLDQTYYMTNMVPQRGPISPVGDFWSKLEQHVRDLTKTYKNVYSCTGSMFLPRKAANGKTYVKYEVLGENNIAVPTHIYKMVMAETSNNEREMWCYLMENKAFNGKGKRLEDFYVDPITLQKATGLIYLQGISLSIFSKVNGKPNPETIP